jgi:hypothetical protein
MEVNVSEITARQPSVPEIVGMQILLETCINKTKPVECDSGFANFKNG